MDGQYQLHRLGPGDEDVLGTLARGNKRFGGEGDHEWLPPLGGTEAQRFVADERTYFFVAVHQETNHIAGFAYGGVLFRRHTKLEHLCLYEVGVDQDHAFQTVGRLLLRGLIDEAKRDGIDRAFVITTSDDRDAVELYSSVGATRSGSAEALFGFRF